MKHAGATSAAARWCERVATCKLPVAGVAGADADDSLTEDSIGARG